MAEIRAVFFDIDGTLLSHTSHQVPSSTFEAFERLHERGILCVICSGRSQFELDVLPLQRLKPDGMILLNGMLSFNKDGQPEISHTVEGEARKKLIDVFESCEFTLALVEENRFYINARTEDVVSAQQQLSLVLPETGVYQGDPLYMAVVFGDQSVRNRLKQVLPDFSIMSWADFGADVVPGHAGKEAGIQEWLDLHGLHVQEIMAFGDGENDIGMLQMAGIGVAMGNAHPSVQEAADEVCESVDEDGIFKCLQRHHLI